MLRAKQINKFFNQSSSRRNRFLLAKYLTILCLLLIIFKIYDVAVVNHKSYEKYYVKSNLGFRRDITDRNGNMLATNLVTYSLYVKGQLIEDKTNFVKIIKKIFPDINVASLKKKLNRNSRNLSLVKRDITKQQKDSIEQEGFLGVFFHEDVKRIYPHKNLFSHVIGYVDIDEKGLTGIEKSQNKFLSSEGKEPLQTSLDLDIQSIIRDELAKELKKFSAKGAVAIVMNINNGEILSLVSLPDYDPYKPWVSLKDKAYNNRASLNLHEMGSTFKIFTMALALNENITDLDQEYDVSEPLKVDRFFITDHNKSEEPLSAREIFIKSSNIGTAKIALELDNKLPAFFNKLKLFDPLKIELVEKSVGIKPKKWRKSNIVTASYGYGVSVSALHLIQSVAAILNNSQIFHYATLIKDKETASGDQVVSQKVSKEVREIMQQVVLYGTGRRSKSFLYSIGGKTGTAHKIGISGYDQNRLLSSFISFFPIANPQYIIYINYDEPKGIEETYYYATGGVTAAPVTKRIIERIAPLLSVYPDKL
ncbi:MAG: penicillin-binding protein 2 [Rickettsiales bacterium]|nr:penicillin-binding protein 2 [Rickettsiales bacterium]